MDLKKYYAGVIFIVFSLLLISAAIAGKKIVFHDSGEYITIAKNFAGINNVDLFSTHSLLYPLIISPFLKIWPSLTMLKLTNCMWLFLIGLVLFQFLKDKRAFIIFAFSPLVWHISIQTTPILPASLFFLLAYVFLKKEGLKYNLFYSGFFLGLSYACYDPVLFVAAVFLLVYFWDKKVYSAFMYLIAVGVGVLPRLILDYWLFDMPFYSMIRFFGTNMIVSMGLYPGISNTLIFSNLSALFIVIIISPFLYKLYRLNFQEHGRDLIFLAIAGILLLVRTAGFKYFLIIAPIAIILLGKILTDKEIKWHCIFSIVLIVIVTQGHFSYDYEKALQNDLKNITSEFPNIDYIVSATEATTLATFLWQDKPYIAWYADFNTLKNNQTSLRGYRFAFDSKIKLRDRLVISASFERFENKTYENYIIVSNKNITGYTQDKCYSFLCTYK